MIAGVTIDGHERLRKETENLYQQFYQFQYFPTDVGDDKKKGELKSILEKAGRLSSTINPILDSYHARMHRLNGVRSMDFNSVSRLLIGTGLPNLFEVGFMLHPQYGVPYIPGSSVRGAVRSFCKLRKAFGDQTDSEILRLFGNEPEAGEMGKLQRGSLQFFDMLPEKMPSLELDLVNPHFPKYYQGNQAPRANQDPIPIFFLTVAAGFTFRLQYTSTGAVPEHMDRFIEITLAENGLGAKTALGYGRFTTKKP